MADARERLGIAPFDPSSQQIEVSIDKAAIRLGNCVGSVYMLTRSGILPATPFMQSALWQIPASALKTEAVNAIAPNTYNGYVARTPHIRSTARCMRIPTNAHDNLNGVPYCPIQE